MAFQQTATLIESNLTSVEPYQGSGSRHLGTVRKVRAVAPPAPAGRAAADLPSLHNPKMLDGRQRGELSGAVW
jgi:hypothetical protein